MPQIVSTHTPALYRKAVALAAERLRAGDVVVIPTETVYGLAANAMDSKAVARIYAVKQRPAENPIIVHVASSEGVRVCASEWSPFAERLARAFWPGPLTLVVPRSSEVPDIVSAGGPTVGLRWPAHPFIQSLIQACGFPIAAPSANLSNHLSPTRVEHSVQDLGGQVGLFVDGGACQVGIESTVVDLTRPLPRVLRPGMITEDAVLAALDLKPSPEATPDAMSAPLRSPGQLPKHYSPKARLRVVQWANEGELRNHIQSITQGSQRVHVIAHRRIPTGLPPSQITVIPEDPEAYARALYAQLHACDDAGAEWVIVEGLPDAPAWKGLADRLTRASVDN